MCVKALIIEPGFGLFYKQIFSGKKLWFSDFIKAKRISRVCPCRDTQNPIDSYYESWVFSWVIFRLVQEL